MGNFYFSNSNLIIFLLILSEFFSDCNGIRKLYPLITTFSRNKGKHIPVWLSLIVNKYCRKNCTDHCITQCKINECILMNEF
jgi:hypothetical protein